LIFLKHICYLVCKDRKRCADRAVSNDQALPARDSSAWAFPFSFFGSCADGLPCARGSSFSQKIAMKISAIIPAYNEAENIALVVEGLLALQGEGGSPLIDEVIVANNNSTDKTAEIAHACGARVIDVPARGYGNACAAACAVARGDVFVFVDGDHTADLSQTALLIAPIARGADLVIGARTHATRGSLTLPQRFGNALSCALVRAIWSVPVTDLGPFRAIRRDAYERIGMRDRAYGWTIEMQVRAAQLGLFTREVPVSWFPRYAGKSKVSGTVRGVIGAGIGILSMIARLRWRQWREREQSTTAPGFARSPFPPYQLVNRPPAEPDCPQQPHAGPL
jgi:glycosyltransferase involved in cell wall biosynthesis